MINCTNSAVQTNRPVISNEQQHVGSCRVARDRLRCNAPVRLHYQRRGAALCSFWKLARVLVLRDKQTRRSRGVAFVQFVRAEDCAKAVAKMDKRPLEGMLLAVSLSRDNGRSQEFAKKRKYTTSQRCFECGEMGHVSYECPRNVLGTRERPVTTGGKSSRKKLKKKKKKIDLQERAHYFNDKEVVNILYVATRTIGLSVIKKAI